MKKKKPLAIRAHEAKMRALRELEDSDGCLRPDSLVAAAKRNDHPWHESFEWNDTKAADAYRLETARHIIRKWSPIRVTNETAQKRMPVYVRDPRLPASKQGYVNVSRVQNDEDLKREVLISEFQRARSALQRAYDVADVLNARKQVKALIEKINYLCERSESAKL